jgi:hypothetical protein
MRRIPPEFPLKFNRLHGIISQKIVLFMATCCENLRSYIADSYSYVQNLHVYINPENLLSIHKSLSLWEKLSHVGHIPCTYKIQFKIIFPTKSIPTKQFLPFKLSAIFMYLPPLLPFCVSHNRLPWLNDYSNNVKRVKIVELLIISFSSASCCSCIKYYSLRSTLF